MTNCINLTGLVSFFHIFTFFMFAIAYSFQLKIWVTFIPELLKVHRPEPEANANVGVSEML